MKKLDLSKIKCVITDFDGTLYSDGNWGSDFDMYILNALKDLGFLPKNRKSLASVYKYMPEFHEIQTSLKFIQDKGGNPDVLIEYMDKHIYNFLLPETRIIDVNILKELSKHYKLYLLSDSNSEYISHYMKKFKMKKSWFVDCVSNEFKTPSMSKQVYMEKFMKDQGLSLDEVIMVGDSKRFDIAPAKLAGIQHFWVKDVNDTARLFNELISLKNND